MNRHENSFADQFIDMVDAMRLISHNAMRDDSTFTRGDDHEAMTALQCTARIHRDAERVVVTVQPIEGTGDAFSAVQVILRTDRFAQSPLLSTAPSEDGDLFRVFSRLFRHFESDGSANLLRHEGVEYGVITAKVDAQDDRRSELLRDLAVGTASIMGDVLQVLIRHPAFGSKGEAVCVDHEGNVVELPEQDVGSPEAAQIGRLAMISAMTGELVESMRATMISEGVFDLSPMAYTYAPSSDPSTARRNAMAAYARLHASMNP